MHVFDSVRCVPAAAFVCAVLALLLAMAPAYGQEGGRVRAPELSPNLGWLNTDRPLRLKEELKGHVVVLDFWTLGCINCIHILPDLEYLENKYKEQPVAVIGVHSAKFANESSRQSIRNAMQRYGIHHPVVIDDEMAIWNAYTVRGWPGFVVIDSEGYVVGATGGEGQRAVLDKAVGDALEAGRTKGTLAKAPFRPKLDGSVASATGLAFPGKVIAVAPEVDQRRVGWVFIADSSHHRIIAARWPSPEGDCQVQGVYGSGQPGFTDGTGEAAQFFEPQGMAYDGDRQALYVADRKNHALRRIDLKTGAVTTIAGNGQQSRDRAGGKAGREQGLNSPWDLALSPDGKTLYIAMAGPHQLWQHDIESGVTKVLAGSGREDVIDGSAANAALAQPSGLALNPNGRTLFFADSEASAIRLLDFQSDRVMTLIGTGLFDFGDVDGAYPAARLQHALGVTTWKTADGIKLLVADTYNHKIKLLDPRTRKVESWMGVGRDPAAAAMDLVLDEPGGIFLAGQGAEARLFVADTNNHRVVMIDPNTRAWQELMVTFPRRPGAPPTPRDNGKFGEVALRPGVAAKLRLSGTVPKGAHPNAEAPITIRVIDLEDRRAALTRGAVVAQRTLRSPVFPVEIDVPAAFVAEGRKLAIELSFAYCTEGDNASCIPGFQSWLVSIVKGDQSEAMLP